jgi:hypothetical protein
MNGVGPWNRSIRSLRRSTQIAKQPGGKKTHALDRHAAVPRLHGHRLRIGMPRRLHLQLCGRRQRKFPQPALHLALSLPFEELLPGMTRVWASSCHQHLPLKSSGYDLEDAAKSAGHSARRVPSQSNIGGSEKRDRPTGRARVRDLR